MIKKFLILLFFWKRGTSQPYYPVVENKELDCQIRLLAYNYSNYIQPYRNITSVWNSLQLGSYCNYTWISNENSFLTVSTLHSNDTDTNYYVDAVYGNDNNNGSEESPYQTIPYALTQCVRSNTDCSVVLRDSAPFYINKTIILSSNTNNVVQILAYPNEKPILTGALSLSNLSWTPVNIATMNIWKTTLPTSVSSSSSLFTTLFYSNSRYIRARYPNGNPEIDLVPDGYTNASTWLPPVPPKWPSIPIINSSVYRSFDHYFPNYTWAINGTAVNYFTPPEGYWIHPNPPGGVPFAVPAGFTFNPDHFSSQVNLWNAEGICHVFHGEYWGNWIFEIQNVTNNTIYFGKGGNQEARGWSTGGALYCENILAELDSPGEWYYDRTTNELYVYYNSSNGISPPPDNWAISTTDVLLHIQGTNINPLQNIILNGLTFTGTQSVFLSANFRAPSGGDMSYSDSGSLILEGTENVIIQDCTFENLGGTAILIRGYNRNTQIYNNSFLRLGEHGIMSAGYTNYSDATNGIAPIGTIIEGNIFQKVGIFVKQTGAYYSALSGNATIRKNIMMESSRALININDGCYGGHLIEQNLFINAVMETADHGAINTWSRSPYVWKIENGNAVIDPLPTILRSNFIINSYYGIHSMDHDDGSYNMYDTQNVIAFAGVKNYEGFAKISTNNLFIAPDFLNSSSTTFAASPPVTPSGVPLPMAYYFPACARTVGQYTWGTALADQYINNICLLINENSPYLFGQCNPSDPESNGEIFLTSNNTFITNDGSLMIHCGNELLNLTKAQSVGMETGSQVMSANAAGLTSPAAIAQYMGKFLGME